MKIDAKLGTSKRSSSVNISSSRSKKRRKSVESDGLDSLECSSEEAVYSQHGEEEGRSGQSSDCSVFDTRIQRKLSLSRQRTSKAASQSMVPVCSSQLNLHVDDLPDSLLNTSTTPTVSLLRSDAPTPDLPSECNDVTPLEILASDASTPDLPSEDDHVLPPEIPECDASDAPIPDVYSDDEYAVPPPTLPSIQGAVSTSSTLTQPQVRAARIVESDYLRLITILMNMK